MARKQKQRKTGYDREVTEDGGRLKWEVMRLTFRFAEGTVGVNLSVEVDGTEHAVTYCRDLKEAGYTAEGFVCGWMGRHAFEAYKAADAAKQ